MLFPRRWCKDHVTMANRKSETEVGSLHLLTLDLLKSSEQTTYDVAKETGLTYSWICAFAADKMRNPSVSKVQRLYEYLTGRNLIKSR